MTKFIQNDLNIDFHKSSKKRGRKTGPSRVDNMLSGQSSANQPKGVYQTIIVPSDSQNSCSNGQVLDESLKNHINLATGRGSANGANLSEEEHQVLLQHINALRDQLLKRERETEVTLTQNNQYVAEVMDKNKKLEKLNIELNKEYFCQRVKFEQNEHKLQ